MTRNTPNQYGQPRTCSTMLPEAEPTTATVMTAMATYNRSKSGQRGPIYGGDSGDLGVGEAVVPHVVYVDLSERPEDLPCGGAL